MKRRKRKPVPIPNAAMIAEALARGDTATGTANTNAVTLNIRNARRLIEQNKAAQIELEREECIDEALERGRTIGRLEILAERFASYLDDPSEYRRITLGMDSVGAIAPLLRAEVERLRGKP